MNIDSAQKDKLIIITSSRDLRLKKRMQELNKKYDLILFYFKRPSDSEELRPYIFELSMDQVYSGKIEDGKYLNRIPKYIKLLRNLRKNKAERFYFFGADFQFFFPFLSNKKIYLELADLRLADLKWLNKRLIDYYEKICLKNLTKLILTSEHHYSAYFKKYISKNNVVIIRNKLENHPTLNKLEREIVKIGNEDKIKIGLFGMIRYERVTDKILNFIKDHSDKYELHISGIPLTKYTQSFMKSLQTKHENIFWYGSFLYPDGLESIYKKVHMTFVVYDNSFENVRTLIPNKLYESTLFNKPILAACNTEFGKEVVKNRIGTQIPIDSYTDFENAILKISKERIEKWSINMSKIPENQIFDNDQFLEQI